MEQSIIQKKQEKKFVKIIGKKTFTVTLRYDDSCGNGHNTFSITGEIMKGIIPDISGCIHEKIKKHFPEFTHLIKYHLCSSDGPLHYIANTTYWTKEGNLEYARSSAIWPDATLEQLQDKKLLLERLPALLETFREKMIVLGFIW